MAYLFYNWKFVPFGSFYPFHPLLNTLPPETTHLFFVSMRCLFVCFNFFLIYQSLKSHLLCEVLKADPLLYLRLSPPGNIDYISPSFCPFLVDTSLIVSPVFHYIDLCSYGLSSWVNDKSGTKEDKNCDDGVRKAGVWETPHPFLSSTLPGT